MVKNSFVKFVLIIVLFCANLSLCGHRAAVKYRDDVFAPILVCVNGSQNIIRLGCKAVEEPNEV